MKDRNFTFDILMVTEITNFQETLYTNISCLFVKVYIIKYTGTDFGLRKDIYIIVNQYIFIK